MSGAGGHYNIGNNNILEELAYDEDEHDQEDSRSPRQMEGDDQQEV